MIYLLTFNAINQDGQTETLRFGTESYMSQPDDTPANASFTGRLQQPGNIERHCYSSRKTSGRSSLSVGVIKLVASDGQLDSLMDYDVDGQPVELLVGDNPRDALSTFSTVFVGVLDALEIDENYLTLTVRDRQAVLDVAPNSGSYSATPDGDGLGHESIGGKSKPLTIGVCRNVQLTCVDPNLLIYQVHAGQIQSVSEVYDSGIALNLAADWPDVATLRAEPLLAGTYATCLAAGVIRLGGNPYGTVTADVQGCADGGYVCDVASIMQRVADSYGPPINFDVASVAALALASPAAVGIHVPAGSSPTIAEMFDQLCASIGAWWVPTIDGLIRVGQLSAPSGDPVVPLDNTQIISIRRETPNDEHKGKAVGRADVEYQRNWTAKASVAAGVSVDRQTWLDQEYRTVSSGADDAARVLTVQTLVDDPVDAAEEAVRLLALHGSLRSLLIVTVVASAVASVVLGDVIRVTWPRFQLSAGKLGVVVGRVDNLADNTVELHVYG